VLILGSHWVSLYLNSLLFGGLICLFLLVLGHLFKGPEWREGKVRSWKISWLDFGFLLWLMFLTVVLSSLITDSLSVTVSPGEGEAGIWKDISGGLTMHAALFAVFGYFLLFKRSLFTDPINSQSISVSKALASGGFMLLAAIPAIAATGIGWQYCILLLRSWGIDLPTAPQPLVVVLSDDLPALERSMLIFLAVFTAPIAEELIFRACIYRFFKARFGAINAMFVSSLLFGLIHFNLSSLPSLIILGIFLSISYERAGNLMAPIFFHALFNMNSIILIFLLDDVGLNGPF
jgi:membrane protease YdiL (CAAX protease family)